jgi:hypothetical protein
MAKTGEMPEISMFLRETERCCLAGIEGGNHGMTAWKCLLFYR